MLSEFRCSPGNPAVIPTGARKFPSLPVLCISMTPVVCSFFQKVAEGAREKNSLSPVRTEKPRSMVDSQLTALLWRGGVHLRAAEEGRCLQAAQPILVQQSRNSEGFTVWPVAEFR